MTDIITNSHNKDCKSEHQRVKIKTIDLDTHECVLSCGCVINLILDVNITTY